MRQPRRRSFFFSAPTLLAPRRGRSERARPGGGKHGDRMMWIWYLLLGSGSGSRTVGKFSAPADSQRLMLMCRRRRAPVCGWVWWGTGGGLAKALEVSSLCFLFRSLGRSLNLYEVSTRAGPTGLSMFASTDRVFFPRELGASRVLSCMSNTAAVEGRSVFTGEPEYSAADALRGLFPETVCYEGGRI